MNYRNVAVEDSVQEVSTGTEVRFHVVPGASESTFESYDAWRKSINVRIGSPAEKGAANRELIEFLSQSFKVKKSRVAIVSGETKRSKRVCFHGMAREEVLEILRRLLGED